MKQGVLDLTIEDIPTRIHLDFAIVTDREIHVSGCSTSFTYETYINEVDIDDLFKKRKELISLAKSKGVKISYKNKTFSTLKSIKEKYREDFVEYDFLFKNLIFKWENKLKKGIFTGYGEDKELTRIFETRNKLHSLFNNSTSLSIVSEINEKINRNLKNVGQYDQIYL
jgi:hypothetical protein